MERLYSEIQEKASVYEQLYQLLRSLPEQEPNSIVRRLREGDDAATIMWQMKDGDLPVQTRSTRSHSHAKVKSQATGHPEPSQYWIDFQSKNTQTEYVSDGLPRYHWLNPVLFTLDEPEVKPLAETWTAITDNMNLVQHLLALYFC